jgi:hypothetical protein
MIGNKYEYDDGFYHDLDDDMRDDHENMLETLKKQDRGFTQIYAYKKKSNGALKRSKIDVYTTGCIGNYIRNAETGEYTNYLVGSPDEDLFYSIIWSTGECKSKNGSNVLFYTSPQHYMSHLNLNVSIDKINQWKDKYIHRLKNTEPPKRSIKSVIIN